MSERISVAARTIHNSDRLDIELIESPYGRPPQVAIIWPAQPTTCESGQLDAVVAAAMRILANSVLSPWPASEYNESSSPTGETPRKFLPGRFSFPTGQATLRLPHSTPIVNRCAVTATG